MVNPYAFVQYLGRWYLVGASAADGYRVNCTRSHL
ncbi:hypothetical protein [Sphingobacterium paucimobilis]